MMRSPPAWICRRACRPGRGGPFARRRCRVAECRCEGERQRGEELRIPAIDHVEPRFFPLSGFAGRGRGGSNLERSQRFESLASHHPPPSPPCKAREGGKRSQASRVFSVYQTSNAAIAQPGWEVLLAPLAVLRHRFERAVRSIVEDRLISLDECVADALASGRRAAASNSACHVFNSASVGNGWSSVMML